VTSQDTLNEVADAYRAKSGWPVTHAKLVEAVYTGCTAPVLDGVDCVTFGPDDQMTSSASPRSGRSPALLAVEAFGQFQASVADPRRPRTCSGELSPGPTPAASSPARARYLGGSTSAEVGVRRSLMGRCTSSDTVRRPVHHFGMSSLRLSLKRATNISNQCYTRTKVGISCGLTDRGNTRWLRPSLPGGTRPRPLASRSRKGKPTL
jgi:hypothetical protein